MPHPIDPSTLRILKPTGETVGTGFLVAKNLTVTCAHVIKLLEIGAGDTVDVRFTGEGTPATKARVLPEHWRPDDATDIAILQVDEVPAGVFPLRMGCASESKLKNDLYTFGYAIAAGEQGIGGLGTFITLKQEDNFIQFRMHEANHGHSGAPIYDDKRGVVVGMIKKGHTRLGRNAETTFAIPAETIWQVCLQLKPPIPVLPHRNPIVEGIHLLPYDYDQRIQNFLTEYLGSDQHPVPFGGRDDALHMLDAWLAETTPYLLLAAPAGRGKSALLVRWLDSLSTRNDLALAFIPVSIRFGANMERVFYAALAARLAFLHGDDVPASPETSTAVYRGLVSDYLSKPLANGRTLLVVLDGLDEAADWQAGAGFLPAELPAGVRVVVSARFLAGDADSTPWLRRLNWERSGLASVPSLFPLDRAGVADVLLKMGCPLDELSRDVDIVAELYRLSAGDPLLVSLYVGDLWAKGAEVTRLKPEDLADIQPGYKGYFDRWWDDQKELWGKDKPWLERHVRAVRNLLAGAQGALFLADIHALEPDLESDYIADALDVLQRFIIGDNQTQGYTFSHPKLGQYFWEALTEAEQAQVERRFLVWGERTLQEFIDGKRDPKRKDQIPAYVVRNYGAHLARAKQPIEKWLPLIHHQQWAQAWFTLEGAYGGYLQDVQRVWEQCRTLDRNAIEAGGGAPYFGAQIRCALIETSLHSLAANIPEELIPVLVQVGLWTLPQAWVVIRQMPEPAQQAEAIIGLLSHLEGRQLSEALTVARAIQDEDARAQVLSVLTQRLPEGDLEQVLVAARAIQDERDRASVLNDLVQRMPEVTGEALAAAQAIQDEWFRADMLSDLAQRLPDRELGQILAVARAIQDEWSRASVLSDLAQRLPGVGAEALTAVRAIQDEWDRTSALSELAQRMPEAAEEALAAAQEVGNVRSHVQVLGYMAQRMPELAREALEAARAIQDEGFRAQVLSDLAQQLPEVAGEALATARAIQNELDRARVLNDLAQRLPEGELEQVLVAVQAIQDGWDHSHALSALAQRMPEGELEKVLAVARTIQHEWDRANLLSALAQRMPEVAGEALVAARAVRDEGYRARVLSGLAQCLPEVAGEALTAARAIQDEGDRARVLSALVQSLPKVAGEALMATRAIQDEWPRACVLSELVQHLPVEELEQALAETQAIQAEWDRISVLSTLAQRLPEGDLAQVLAAARAIRDEGSRARVLGDLAQRLPEVAGEALVAARAIQNEESRAHVLSDLAQRLPEDELGQVLDAAQAMQDEGKLASVLSDLTQRLPERELEKILVAARAIRAEWDRAHVLSTLAQRLPGVTGEALAAIQAIQDEESRADMLSDLAQRLPENELEPVLAVARAIQNEEYRASVLSHLAQRLPEVVGEALAAARTIQYEADRATVLSNLARCIPEVAGEALETARAIQDGGDQDGWYYARAMSELAQRMPEGELEQVLAAAWAIRGEEGRANVLSILAQRLPKGKLGQVLAAARVIQDKGYRASVLINLAQPMMKIPHKKSLLLMETSLAELSHRTRSNLYSDLAALMPVILHLGADGTPREIYEAIRDVTTWWP